MGNRTTAGYLTNYDVTLELGGNDSDNRKRLTRLFTRMDRDGNGVVTWEEFVLYVQGLQRLAASGARVAGGGEHEGGEEEEESSSPDVMDTTNMPAWARTNNNNSSSNSSSSNNSNSSNNNTSVSRLPLETLNNQRRPSRSSRSATNQKKKSKNNKNNNKNNNNKKTARDACGNPILAGPPQHQLIFDDSFQWNRKNYDLPTKLTKKEKARKRLDKEEKRKKQTQVDPMDKAEALALQVQVLRNQVLLNQKEERKRTAGQMRTIAVMAKRAREAESLLQVTTSGQGALVAPPLAASSAGGGAGGGEESADYLDLKYRYLALEKQHKALRMKVNQVERRELDLLDERAASYGEGFGDNDDGDGVNGDNHETSSSPNSTAPNTSRSMQGRGAIRVEELKNETKRLEILLEQKINAINGMEKKHERQLLHKESDYDLLKRKYDQLVGEIDVERSRTDTLRKELKAMAKRLGRYVGEGVGVGVVVVVVVWLLLCGCRCCCVVVVVWVLSLL